MPNAETDYIYETEGGLQVESKAQLFRADEIERQEFRHRLLQLRRQGFPYDQIAQIVSKGDDDKPPRQIGAEQVRRHVVRYLDDLRAEDTETVEALRQIDNDRLEAMFRRFEIDARITGKENADLRRRAMLAQLRILERHAKLNGLDPPTQIEVGGAVDHHLVASPEHVAAVDRSFRERHGGNVIELPAGHVREVE